MADPPRKSYSRSPSPLVRAQSKSRSRSPSYSRPRPRSHSRIRGRARSRSHGRDEDANPGSTLYITGLSTRVTERDLEDHFSKEGKVASCFLVMEPRTRISRGFAFMTMDSLEGANRAVKYLNQSVLEGRYITVEKSRRKRPRTPTPGHYLGLKSSGETGNRGGGGGGRAHGSRNGYGYRRSPPPRRSPLPYYRGGGGGGRDYSPPPPPTRRSPYGGGYGYGGGRSSRRERSRSPIYSYSPRGFR